MTDDRPDDKSFDEHAPGDPEAGLVVEDDELDLSDPEVSEEAEVSEEPEVSEEAEATDEADVSDEAEVSDEPEATDEAEAVHELEQQHEYTGASEPRSMPELTSDIVIPSYAVSDDWHEEPPAGDGPVVADKKRRHWGRYVLVAVLAVIGAAYVAGYFLTGTRMPASASIAGVDVSGQSPAEARDALEAELLPNADRDIVLTYGKKTFTITPSDAGLALDAQGSVDAAGGDRSWDPRDMVGLFVGDHDQDPVLDVDDAALESSIAAIGEAVDKEVVEAQITFPDGAPKARQPKEGLVVSRSDAATAVRDSYLVSDDPIEVPTVPVEPTVDAEELEAAMTSMAAPAISGPVTINVGDKSVPLPVTAYAPALSIRVQDGKLTPFLDPEKLAGPLTDSTTGIGTKAVDATVTIEGGKPVVVPGKEGLGLQPEEMAALLVPAVTQTGEARSVTIEAKVVEPQFTTKDAEALNITEKISDYTTEFPYAEYRNTNQGRAAELIDGTIIKPGETFSFNDVVGERTEANGFVTGTVINGGVFREELGGGVSQVATTMYNAGFFGGMDDTEHHPHAFYIDRYPVGREATVYFGSLDLRWKNSTDHGVLIHSFVKKSTPSSAGEMHVQLWSTKVWDKIEADDSGRRNGRSPGTQYDDTNRCVPQSPAEGFDIDIIRKFIRDGKVVKTETDTANYQAADRVVCGPRPKPEADEAD